MFEVGFTEIILILGLALLVLGPEKLPGLAEKIGRWTGRARSMARQLRSQLEQEVTLEQLAKSKPMQASPQPAASTPQPPPEGFDLDQHFDGMDTTPEAMHGKPRDENDQGDNHSAVEHAPPIDDVDTTPEAMHGKPKDKVET